MFLVYGLQKSGISIIKLLEKKNIDYKIWDDNYLIRKKLKQNFKSSLFFNPNNNNLSIFSKIFVSPGISLNHKNFKNKRINTKLNRDLNIYIDNLKLLNVIAITGTNGKSTTTKLVGNILKKNKLKTFIGGNIGDPLCNAFISKKKYDFHVIELSSFQLERVKNLNTKISIITNLSNDHLDRYKNIEDYINQKKNIFSNTGKNIISIDDKYSRKIFFQKKLKNKISFSITNKSADFFMGKNFILDNYSKNKKKIIINDISKDLEGNFNYQNILISYICSKILKLPDKYFIETIKNFRGLPYRSKIIFKNKKLKIINNSKSTNLNSLINSIQNYKNIYLILGGIAKEKNFEILSKYIKRIKQVYVFGVSATDIEKKIKNKLKVKKFKTLKILVDQLFNDIKDDKNKLNILFAPACTSYDQYNNFEERGKDFSNLIQKKLINL